jgi:condensin complex subunit 1
MLFREGLGAGRLEDKSSIVRRAALQLLMAMLLYNPFGPHLPQDCFAASLADCRTKLNVRSSSTSSVED